jgi:WS/DGAT/MGAT family acyltransferase
LKIRKHRPTRDNPRMANPDRLSGLDASFLSLERNGAHMHVGSVLVFDGDAPAYEDFVAKLEQRLHLVPRYRQKLAWPPLVQSRPVWIDDPHFNARYHVRHTALPGAAGEEELRNLAGRIFAQGLDRSKPLWELWLVDRVGDDAFALISKTHHALVDGVSGVDISTVLFDLEPDPPEPDPAPAWYPRPEPSAADLLATAVAERASAPLDVARAALEAARHPERAVGGGGRAVKGLAAMAAAGMAGAPPSPLNVRIGSHRRFAWVDADLERFKAIKTAFGGTVNDVVLAAVTGALRAFMIRRGRDPVGMELKAMVPVSVRADTERGALGNRVAAMYAPLPVHAADARERFDLIHLAMGDLKASGQAVGAEVITRLAGFAAPTVLDQAARLQSRQRLHNIVVTNVPGPQFPLYLQGRRLRAFYPQVPLTLNTALGIAIMSYDGRLGFGLLGDYDALPDLDAVAEDLEASIDELADAAGLPAAREPGAPRPRRPKAATT